ncbi:sulfate ABC transporter substrate-binding protein [Ideonella sp.]|uniref:sulfate ABC transporter substrate-binding protein n=1 Tax=Ideonella sp. TaxID=1929293 RepID=UPI0035B29D9A
MHRRTFLATPLGLATLAAPLAPARAQGTAPATTLLNVSYDVSREFYKDFNAAFLAHWQAQGGAPLALNQSHGGSSKQARSVADGLAADVVTMNQANDIDMLAERGLVAADWSRRLPDNAAPTTSVSVILVRAGNPRGIRDWTDLGRPGVSVIVPNPKTSGNGRYTYLAAWGAALRGGAGPDAARALVARLFGNVPVLDGGGRAATTTFAQRGMGDALVTFESEAPLIEREFGGGFERVYPGWTVLAENPVAVVDAVVDRRGTRGAAEAYLRHLWSPQGQAIAARHHLRPRDARVHAAHAGQFPAVRTFTVDEAFGGWSRAQRTHFDDGGVYDQIVAAAGRR